VWYSGGDYVIF